MKNRHINFEQYIDSILLIATGVLSRLLPHPANFTAVGGLALFSGAHFSFKKAFVITIATMFLSDLFLGLHPVMWATYGSFFLAVMIGHCIGRTHSVRNIALACLSSSILFYLITNFAVWVIPNSMYPKTISGLFESYIMALPFFRNSVAGDVLYAGVFFGGYEIVLTIVRRLALSEIQNNR